MRAFHGDRELKIRTAERVRRHIEAGRQRTGIWWDGTNGCAVGITIESDVVEMFEDVLGIPVDLAALEMKIFEADVPEYERRWFALDFLDAIEVGVDLTGVAEMVDAESARMLRDMRMPDPQVQELDDMEGQEYWMDAYSATIHVDALIRAAEELGGGRAVEVLRWIRACTLRALREAPVAALDDVGRAITGIRHADVVLA